MSKSIKRKSKQRASAFAPATVANVAVGFDIMGFALEGLGEVATVERIPLADQASPVIIGPIKGFPEIVTEPEKNTAGAGLLRLIQDQKLKFGFRVQLVKQIPVGSGLGGSSTSAVAALVAANALLDKSLSPHQILEYALIGEEVASGSRHADNVGPCLLGGLLFVRSFPRLSYAKIKTPSIVRVVILLPKLSIKTKEARQILKPEVPLSRVIEQTANLTGFILGCVSKDLQLIRESLRDAIIEPQRAALIPGFSRIQLAAMNAGALGCSISGSGPAMFALALDQKTAVKIQKQMRVACHAAGTPVYGSWISGISKRGAHLNP
ncbi:MAG: homoserine kinase [Bdellovibrionales bacterium]|nr:homoserine kinase [Bdellovibrionales bacterium]